MSNAKSVYTCLHKYSCAVMSGLPDNRLSSNGQKYDMQSIGMGGLSVFLMQDPSFLSHQSRLSRGSSSHNFASIFGCSSIPTPNQIRNVLDGVDPANFISLYDNALALLSSKGGLSGFKYLDDSYLIALDGTEFQSSQSIKCNSCTIRNHGSKTIYSHSLVAASIVSPDSKEAVALVPEFIVPQDGHQKQDCENAAIKRWLIANGERYQHLNPTILGDDLFSRQSICEAVLQQKYHFIFVCKPDSHKTLYSYLQGIKLTNKSITISKRGKKRIYQYQFINQVPIRDGEDALNVNWLEVKEIDKKSDKVIYKNTFITDLHITPDNIHKIAMSGRARWKIENENNNTLKTKGYHFEHNYGHGKKHLSSIFATLAIIAFLYHTIMNIVDLLYIKARKENGSRINFFNLIKALSAFIIFKSWDHLISTIAKPPDNLQII